LVPETQVAKLDTQIKLLYDAIPANIVAEYFTRNEVSKNIFKCAKEFEKHAYLKTFASPNLIDNELKSIISISLDYFGIDRKTFFNVFN
jgi:hypothetical protein